MKQFAISLVVISFSLPIVTVSAQAIDPRCTEMRDKVGCTCAVQNGGNVAPYCPDRYGRKAWCYPARGLHGYVECMHRYGRK